MPELASLKKPDESALWTDEEQPIKEEALDVTALRHGTSAAKWGAGTAAAWRGATYAEQVAKYKDVLDPAKTGLGKVSQALKPVSYLETAVKAGKFGESMLKKGGPEIGALGTGADLAANLIGYLGPLGSTFSLAYNVGGYLDKLSGAEEGKMTGASGWLGRQMFNIGAGERETKHAAEMKDYEKNLDAENRKRTMDQLQGLMETGATPEIRDKAFRALTPYLTGAK